MRSPTSINDILFNISSNLRQGGYFIATTLDGHAVYQAFAQADRTGGTDGTLTGFKERIRIWELKRQYPASAAFESSGQPIGAYNVSIGQEIPEYLVNFDYFIKTARQFGLEPIPDGELPDLKTRQSFGDLYARLSATTKGIVQSNIRQMSDDEKRYSFLNNYLILKKTGSPSVIMTDEEANQSLIPTISPQSEPSVKSHKIVVKKKLTPVSTEPTPVSTEPTPAPTVTPVVKKKIQIKKTVT